MENDILFFEKQKPSQWWIILIIIFYTLFLSYLVYSQVFKGVPFLGFEIPDNVLLVLWAIFGLVVPIGFFTAELNIMIKNDGIYIKYFPFHWDYIKIPLEDIDDFEEITYNPLKDYGGWGIRYGAKGNAFNAHGNKGVNIKTSYSRDLLIGSQKTEELFKAIKKAKAKHY